MRWGRMVDFAVAGAQTTAGENHLPRAVTRMTFTAFREASICPPPNRLLNFIARTPRVEVAFQPYAVPEIQKSKKCRPSSNSSSVSRQHDWPFRPSVQAAVQRSQIII